MKRRSSLGRPTRRAWSLLGAALLIFLIGANVQAGWLYVLGAAIAGVVIAGIALPPGALRGLEVSREMPPTAMAGDPVTVTLRVANPGNADRGVIEGRDRLFEDAPFFIERLPSGASVPVAYRSEGARRGIYTGAEVELSTSAPFGIGTARRTVQVASPAIVHPRWVPLAGFPMLEAASIPNETLHERRRRGGGLDFYGLREYRSGDSLRHVHWPSTARGGRLLVREYEEQPASRLGVLIDSGNGGGDYDPVFETAVSCAASLGIYALEAGHPVQVAAGGPEGARHLFEPSRLELLDWLAGLKPGRGPDLAALAKEMAGEIQRRSTNVLIFPATEKARTEAPAAAAWLQEQSSRVIAILVSVRDAPREKASPPLGAPEEEALIAQLAGGRTIVYRVTSDEELGTCLREPLHF